MHTLIWIGLGLAVSARARRQGTALVVLLTLWFVNAFVMPPLAMAAAKWRDPSPSAIEFRGLHRRTKKIHGRHGMSGSIA